MRFRDDKVKVARVFYEKLTAKEQKWLVRIILKGNQSITQRSSNWLTSLFTDLKISLGEKMILSCIHQDAIDLFNVCSDLRAVCWKLWDTSKRLPNEVCEMEYNNVALLNVY
jgi:DNA ligase-4